MYVETFINDVIVAIGDDGFQYHSQFIDTDDINQRYQRKYVQITDNINQRYQRKDVQITDNINQRYQGKNVMITDKR